MTRAVEWFASDTMLIRKYVTKSKKKTTQDKIYSGWNGL